MMMDKLDKKALEKDFKDHNSFLFDMDGTIIQSELIHAMALQKILKKAGLNLKTSKLEKDFNGLPDPDVYQKVFKEKNYGPILTREISNEDDFISIKNKAISDIIENIPTNDFKKLLIPGLIEFLKEIKSNKFFCGLVSASEKPIIHLILKKANILDFFDIITPRLKGKPNKPDPFPYVSTMMKLGTSPKKTIIFEDSELGLKAANSSGASKVIKVSWKLQDTHSLSKNISSSARL